VKGRREREKEWIKKEEGEPLDRSKLLRLGEKRGGKKAEGEDCPRSSSD